MLRAQLEAETPWAVDGADLNLGALRAAPAGRGVIRYYDVEERHAAYLGAYDVVTLCDVIEHIDETRPFMEAVVAHLKPGGLLLLSVPALPGLYSAYDEAAGHVRRYTSGSLAAECEGVELELLDTRYWGLSMVPLLALRKFWVRPGRREASVLEEGFVPPGDFVHAILRGVMRTETGLLRRASGWPRWFAERSGLACDRRLHGFTVRGGGGRIGVLILHGPEELGHPDRRVAGQFVERGQGADHAGQEVRGRVLAVLVRAVLPNRDLVVRGGGLAQALGLAALHPTGPFRLRFGHGCDSLPFHLCGDYDVGWLSRRY